MIADRILATRDATWEQDNQDGLAHQRARIDRGEDRGARRHTSTVEPDDAPGTPALPPRSVLREPQG